MKLIGLVGDTKGKAAGYLWANGFVRLPLRQAVFPWSRLYAVVCATDDVVVPDIATEDDAIEIRRLGGFVILCRRAGGKKAACVRPDFVLVHDGRRKSWRKRVDRIMRTIQAMDLSVA
jgi:hypothetical protein